RHVARAADEKVAGEQWQALFAPLDCSAGPPAVMRRFLAEIGRLREQRTELIEAEAVVARGARLLAEERPGLEAIAGEPGLAGTAAQSLPSLIRLIEDRLEVLEQGARETHSVGDQLAA